MTPSRIAGPVILIALGLLFLINNLLIDVSFRDLFREFWPLILVVIGAAQLAGAATVPVAQKWGRISGGVVLVTLGMLFLVSKHTVFDFRDTWPVLLVVVGGLGLFRAVGPGRMFPGGFSS